MWNSRKRWCVLSVGVVAPLIIWLLLGGIMIRDEQKYRGYRSNILPGDNGFEEYVDVGIAGNLVRRNRPWGVSRNGEEAPYSLIIGADFPEESTARVLTIGKIRATLIDTKGEKTEVNLTPSISTIALHEFSYGNQEPKGFVTHTVWRAHEPIALLSGLEFATHQICRIELDGVISAEDITGAQPGKPFRLDVEFYRFRQRSVLPYVIDILKGE